MAAFNSNLTSDAANVLVGSGRLLFASADSTTGGPDTNGWRDLGNVTDFTISFSTDTVERQNFRECEVKTDLQLNNGTTASLSFTGDEVTTQNIAMLTGGQSNTMTIELGTAVTDEALTTNAAVGSIYELYTAADGRYSQLTETPTFELDTVAIPTSEYEVDLERGTVKFLAAQTGAITWSVSAGTDKTVAVADGLTGDSVQGLLRLEGINRNNCEPFEITLFRVILRPEGDLALIGTDVAEMTFSGAISSSAAAKAYYGAQSSFFQAVGHQAIS